MRLRDGAILDVNDAACQVLGRSREEILGRTSLELEIYADPHQR